MEGAERLWNIKRKLLICDDTMEGIFTAVYDGWRWGNRGFSVGIAVREPDYPELFYGKPGDHLRFRQGI